MINFIIQQLRILIKDKATWILLYLVSLFFGLLVGIPFYLTAETIGGNSMELDRLVSNFDFSTFFDFTRKAGKSFRPQYMATAALGFMYFLLNIFFAGGVVDRAEHLKEKFSFSRFISSSARTFPRYLGAYVLMLLVSICIFFASGIIYFVATLLADSGNDRSLILWLSIPTIILVVSLSFMLTVQDYTKVLLYKYEHLGIGTAFSKAFGFVFKNPKTLLNLWILIAFAMILFAVYSGLDYLIGMTGIATIILFFIIQQVVSFIRIFLRFSHLRVAAQYLHLKPINIPPPKVIEFLDEIDEDLQIDEDTDLEDEKLED